MDDRTYYHIEELNEKIADLEQQIIALQETIRRNTDRHLTELAEALMAKDEVVGRQGLILDGLRMMAEHIQTVLDIEAGER